jgi:hypothetical protein
MPRIDRALAMYGLVLAIGGSLFVLLFWAMGAVHLQRGAGLIHDLQLSGMWSTLFWIYPLVTFATVFAAVLAYLAKLEAAALGVAGLPIVGVVVYYLALVTFY